MKSRINFYSDELKPEKEFITLTGTVSYWGLLLFVLILISLSFQYFNLNSHTEAEQLKANIEQHKNSLQLAEKKLQKKRDQSILISRINKKKQELKEKDALLSSIDERLETEQIDYEQVMVELATHVHKDVWLTEFNLSSNGLTLTGLATDGSAIPVWFASLHNSYYFSNKTFSKLEFDEQDKAVSFQIATQGEIRK